MWNGINLVALTAFMVVAFAETRSIRGRRSVMPASPDPVHIAPDPVVPEVEVLDRSAITSAKQDVESLLESGHLDSEERDPQMLPRRYAHGDAQLGVMPTPVHRGRYADDDASTQEVSR